VAVPLDIKEQIRSWDLSRRLLIEVYSRLNELGPKHEEVCMHLAAPTPTFVYSVDVLEDQDLPSKNHGFTFWLTYGEQDGVLYVRQCDHYQEEV